MGECVTNLQRFIDAGADEIATYGSTLMQNAQLVGAWRERHAPTAAASTSEHHGVANH